MCVAAGDAIGITADAASMMQCGRLGFTNAVQPAQADGFTHFCHWSPESDRQNLGTAVRVLSCLAPPLAHCDDPGRVTVSTFREPHAEHFMMRVLAEGTGVSLDNGRLSGQPCLPLRLNSNVTLSAGCEGQAAQAYARLPPAHGASNLARFQARVRV